MSLFLIAFISRHATLISRLPSYSCTWLEHLALGTARRRRVSHRFLWSRVQAFWKARSDWQLNFHSGLFLHVFSEDTSFLWKGLEGCGQRIDLIVLKVHVDIATEFGTVLASVTLHRVGICRFKHGRFDNNHRPWSHVTSRLTIIKKGSSGEKSNSSGGGKVRSVAGCPSWRHDDDGWSKIRTW